VSQGVGIDAPGALFDKDPGDGAFPTSHASGKTDHEALHRRRFMGFFA
jgi:hypothetical protein